MTNNKTCSECGESFDSVFGRKHHESSVHGKDFSTTNVRMYDSTKERIESEYQQEDEAMPDVLERLTTEAEL